MKLTYEQRVERLKNQIHRHYRYYACVRSGCHIETLDCGPLCACGEPTGIHDLPKRRIDGTGQVLTWSDLRREFVAV